jgi:hypothetical protein
MTFGTVYKLDTGAAQIIELVAGESHTHLKAIRAYSVLLLATVDCHIALSAESDAPAVATEDDFLLMAGQYLPIACNAGGSIAVIPASIPALDPTWRAAIDPNVTGAGRLYITPIVSMV